MIPARQYIFHSEGFQIELVDHLLVLSRLPNFSYAGPTLAQNHVGASVGFDDHLAQDFHSMRVSSSL